MLKRYAIALGAALLLFVQGNLQGAFSAPLPGGTLDPLTVPKYVTPLVIPPGSPCRLPAS